MHTTCPAVVVYLHFVIPLELGKEYKWWSILLCVYLP